MAVPRKVKEKAAQAEKLIARRVNTPVGDPAGQPQPELTVVTDAPEASPLRANPYAIDPSAGVTPPMAEPVTEDWKHKYNVLHGMFDKSRSENSDKISQLESQIGVLTNMVSEHKTREETFHPSPLEPVNYGFTEEQIEEMGGQDFIDNIGKISAASAAGEIANLKNELGQLKDTQTETLDDVFYNRLSELSPHWRAINADERFNQWLTEGDGLSGIPRSSFLTNAYDTRDAETAARYFNEFAGKLPSPPDLNPDVQTDIIPEFAGPGNRLESQSGNIYSPQSITQFFKDKGLGKFKGREDEAAAIEKDIFAAQREGRIRR